MNTAFRNINIEEVLFFDLESVRKNNELDKDSKEFELYQKKIRNKETDELPDIATTLEHYNKKAALKIGYNRIVCATVGRVVNGIVYLRSFIGEEQDILKNLFAKFQETKYLAGFNVLEFDGVVARVNALQYGDLVLSLPEQFNDSNKRPWDMKSVLDLMNVFKGVHYYNSSLDEVCYHLGIESPKEGGIEGSQVSEAYYDGKIVEIERYCKRDVFAVVNIFRKLQFKPVYESYVDANLVESTNTPVKELSVLERLYNGNTLSPEIKNELSDLLINPTEEDKVNLKKILLAHYQKKGDKVAVKKAKEEEINKYLYNL